jgi:hypothetical protein
MNEIKNEINEILGIDKLIESIDLSCEIINQIYDNFDNSESNKIELTRHVDHVRHLLLDSSIMKTIDKNKLEIINNTINNAKKLI